MNQCFFQLVKVVSLDVEEKVRIPICTDVRKSLARVDSQFYIELLEMLLAILANGPGDLKTSVLKVFLPDGVDILTLAFYFILIALWIAAQNFLSGICISSSLHNTSQSRNSALFHTVPSGLLKYFTIGWL